jgi:predicted secreted protein
VFSAVGKCHRPFPAVERHSANQSLVTQAAQPLIAWIAEVPLGDERHFSKSAVSRIVGALKALFATCYAFPPETWKSIRTTNTIENLNREFRRRTKTQASFSTEAAALTALYGLVAFGQIQLRKIDGHTKLPSFLEKGVEESRVSVRT